MGQDRIADQFSGDRAVALNGVIAELAENCVVSGAACYIIIAVCIIIKSYDQIGPFRSAAGTSFLISRRTPFPSLCSG